MSILCVLALFIDLSVRSIARWFFVHNQTFDLAFYIRIAWGFTEGDLWNPLVGASIWGLRISPVLYPLGWIGKWLGMAPTLLIAQALAVAGAGWLMMRIASRRLGINYAWLGPLSWSLYPHLGHVGTYEFHPGTLALLPLVWMIDAYDRASPRAFFWGAVGVILCREDFTVTLIAFSLMVAWTRADLRRSAYHVIALSTLWLLGFTLILHPHFAPPRGSMSLHFGHWGATAPEAIGFIITHPILLWAHLTTSARLFYIIKLMGPLALTPLIKPRWIIPILPTLGMNVLSQFPNTTALDSHYLTPALPFLIVAGIEGFAWGRDALVQRWSYLSIEIKSARQTPLSTATLCVTLWVMTLGVAHYYAGGTPLARDYPAWDFKADEHTQHARSIIAQIPRHRSVQVPDRLTPHLAERVHIYRAKTPYQDVEYIVIDQRELKHQPLRERTSLTYRLLTTRGHLELWARQ